MQKMSNWINMRKNGSRLITLRQYRLTDLFLFAVILIGFELILHFAFIRFNGDFTFSPLVPIVLLVMMRWGWPSLFFAAGDGLLYCLLKMNGATFQPCFFAVYIIGNLCSALLLLATKYIGKERIRKKWYNSALFLLSGWVLVWLGRSAVGACFGGGLGWLMAAVWDFISLAIGLVLVLILRRLDGMFEDQKHYLLRLEAEREEKRRRDEFGDEPIEIDEQTISILKRWDEGLGD